MFEQPTLSYAMVCVGSALGLRCIVRALATTGRSRRNWLITGASALGTGIWTMHFIAMLGFTVSGSEIRYDVPLTVLSLLVAMLVVGVGVFTVGYGRGRPPALAVGGLTTGLGVAAMHHIGMAALRLHGTISYDPWLVMLSVLIAVPAATICGRLERGWPGPLGRARAVRGVMTGGRTRPDAGGGRLDLIAQVFAEPGVAGGPEVAPEHTAILALCHREPLSVAELAADCDLPVGVVRVLLGDLLAGGRVRVLGPVPPAHLPDERILREVIEGLRAL